MYEGLLQKFLLLSVWSTIRKEGNFVHLEQLHAFMFCLSEVK